MSGVDIILLALLIVAMVVVASVWGYCEGTKFGYLSAIKATAKASQDSNVESVRTKLLTRSMIGVLKYGTTTERGDLTTQEWLDRLQEELMDATVYIESIKSHGELK